MRLQCPRCRYVGYYDVSAKRLERVAWEKVPYDVKCKNPRCKEKF